MHQEGALQGNTQVFWGLRAACGALEGRFHHTGGPCKDPANEKLQFPLHGSATGSMNMQPFDLWGLGLFPVGSQL